MRAAVAYGFDFTSEQAAEFAGVSVTSVKRWKHEPEIRAVSETVAACLAVSKSKNLKEAAQNALQSNEQRMKSVLDRALRQTERALTSIENEKSPDFQQLLQVHQNITMWATKFFVSEAPKRLQVEGSHEHKHILLTAADAERIFLAKQQLQAAQPKALIAGVSDVIDVDAN